MSARIASYLAFWLLLVAAFVGPCGLARAADLDAPVVLVATPALSGSVYGETVLLAVPLGDGSHFGFILNRPSDSSLAAVFPEDEASRRANARVYLGGPVMVNALFALVRGRKEADQGLIEVAPELFVALRGDAVHRIIAQRPGDARFFAGYMGWRPGELAEQIRAGAWATVTAEADVVLGVDSSDMWNQLAPYALGTPVNFSR